VAPIERAAWMGRDSVYSLLTGLVPTR